MGNKLQVHRYMCTCVIYFTLTTIQYEQKTWYVTIRFIDIYIIVLRVGLLLNQKKRTPVIGLHIEITRPQDLGIALQVCNLLSFVAVICGACEVTLYSTRHKILHEWQTLPGSTGRVLWPVEAAWKYQREPQC